MSVRAPDRHGAKGPDPFPGGCPACVQRGDAPSDGAFVAADQARNGRKPGSRGGRPPRFAPVDYRERHAVECGINRLNGINRLKRQRAVATRYDKLAVRYEVTVLVAAINE
ncbi:hypothetical protein ACFXOI_15440 [Streptomyces bacillaris]|uniref:hypothetical protein n=1 Tax=Streptomyces bacillaris TaxID=68179 RepID=UPI0036CC4CAC